MSETPVMNSRSRPPGSPAPFFAQLPAKLPPERTAAGQGLQLHQGEVACTVENAARVAEYRVFGKLSFERLRYVKPGHVRPPRYSRGREASRRR